MFLQPLLSRYLHGIRIMNWEFKRLMLSKLATMYVQFITRMPFTDTTSGFKCWRRETLETVKVEETFSNGYLFQIETTYKTYSKKLKIVEVPITFFDRSNGHSKMNWNIVLEALWGVLRLRLKNIMPDAAFPWSGRAWGLRRSAAIGPAGEFLGSLWACLKRNFL